VTEAVQKQDGGWLGGITNTLELALTFLKDGLMKLHVPYSYGFAIILLTLIVKAATYPLTKKQVESTLNMQNLQPKIKAIQERYKGDQERIQLETARLYKQAGVNPLAGCLPTLATLPIWIGLYRALSNVANEGLLTEGFFWIPSLAGPTTIAARTNGSGISWLFPFVDGAPPLGWGDTISYLVLPVLLIISQYISMQMMQPPQANDPSQANTQLILKFLPLMIGYFALSVPSGLSLYWLTNNILSTGQQVYLRQLGGAKAIVAKDGGDIISAGQAKRTPLPPSSAATASSTVTTDVTSAKDARGQRFRQLKEEEAKKKEARQRAAEEASKAAAAKAAEERDQMLRAQRAQEAQQSSASSTQTNEEEDEQSDEEVEGFDSAESKEEALAANGAVGTETGPNRTKRSKRRRAP